MSNWNQVLEEINSEITRHTLAAQQSNTDAQQAINTVRRKYLCSLSERTSRNTIAYYSGFLSKPWVLGMEINDEDKNGLMMAIHGLDRQKGLGPVIKLVICRQG